MSLNIKNERVHDLARRAASVTGLSQTAVIEQALTELLAARGEGPTDEPARKMAAARSVLADVVLESGQSPAGRVTDVDDLYDERTGLPR